MKDWINLTQGIRVRRKCDCDGTVCLSAKRHGAETVATAYCKVCNQEAEYDSGSGPQGDYEECMMCGLLSCEGYCPDLVAMNSEQGISFLCEEYLKTLCDIEKSDYYETARGNARNEVHAFLKWLGERG